MATSLTRSKVVNFNDGQALAYDDLNAIVRSATSRAWEIPGYWDLWAADFPFDSTPNTRFDAPTGINGRVFVKGGGVAPNFSGLTVTPSSGFIGTYVSAAYPADTQPVMRWVYLAQADSISFTHAAAGGGNYRYDLITVAMTEAASDSQNVDFKDGTTGALSTQSLNTRRSLTAQFTVTQGVAAGSIGAAVIPNVPVGQCLLYVVLVGPSAIQFVQDVTVPVGQPRFFSAPVGSFAISANTGTDWGVAAGQANIVAVAGNKQVVIAVPYFGGDPHARLLSLLMKYRLTAGTGQVEIGSHLYGQSPASGFTPITDITGRFTVDGADHETLVDLRGWPDTNAAGPYWCHGSMQRTDTVRGVIFPRNTLALRITSGGVGDYVQAIAWSVVK